MSSKENNAEVAVDKVTENSEKGGGDVKAEVKGTKRPAEVSTNKSIITHSWACIGQRSEACVHHYTKECHFLSFCVYLVI